MPDTLESRFEACIDQNADSLYRVAFRLMGREDLARELVQESFLQAWANLQSLRNPDRIRAWLFAILRNQYAKRLRTETRWQNIPPEQVEMITAPQSDQSEREVALREALQQLEPAQKLPLLLVSMEGLSTVEAAEVLEIPVGTVLSRLHRGREKLKEALARHPLLQHPTAKPGSPPAPEETAS